MLASHSYVVAMVANHSFDVAMAVNHSYDRVFNYFLKEIIRKVLILQNKNQNHMQTMCAFL